MEVLSASHLLHQINKKASTHQTEPKDSPLASIRKTPKVMLLEELMTLVLHTKSICQCLFTLINRTLEYLQHDAMHSQCTCS
jgi:hypothetical protein